MRSNRPLCRKVCATLLLLWSGVGWSRAADAPLSDEFESRRLQILASVWSAYQVDGAKLAPRNRFFAAEALFESGHDDAGRLLTNTALDNIEPNKRNRWIYGGNSGFTAWPGIDCYCRFSDRFDQSLKDRFKRIYTGAVFYKQLTTSNHKIMAAVTRCLATQVWGADAFKVDSFFPPGSSNLFNTKDPTGEKYVRQMIEQMVKTGPGEYASRPYGAQNILPILTIAECSNDPDLRQRAHIAYEVGLAQLAPAYLHGHLGTFSTRSYPDMLSQSPWGIASLLWVYFGGVPNPHIENEWGLRAAVADYQPPPQLLCAGTDRTRPYVYRAMISNWALYHFVNGSYVHFSASPKPHHPVVLGQNYPTGVMWDEPDTSRASQLWITNPAADVGPTGENLASGIHTHGVTHFQQQVQYRDASLSVFNIDPKFRNPYVLGFIPGGYRATINSSKTNARVLLHYGTVMIAITAASPFDWDPSSGIAAPAGPPPKGSSEFRIKAIRTAVAIETAAPNDFPAATPGAQLQSFAAALAKSVINFDGDKTGTYTDRAGNTIACTFDGNDRTNAQVIDYTAWPLLESPWTQQANGNSMTLTNGIHPRLYDFQQWKISE